MMLSIFPKGRGRNALGTDGKMPALAVVVRAEPFQLRYADSGSRQHYCRRFFLARRIFAAARCCAKRSSESRLAI